MGLLWLIGSPRHRSTAAKAKSGLVRVEPYLCSYLISSSNADGALLANQTAADVELGFSLAYPFVHFLRLKFDLCRFAPVPYLRLS